MAKDGAHVGQFGSERNGGWGCGTDFDEEMIRNEGEFTAFGLN